MPAAAIDINRVIGKRLTEVIGRGGADFRRRMNDDLGEEWAEQTYHDARAGRRIFRVSELVALARAAGVQAYELLEAPPGARVIVSRRHAAKKVTLSAEELTGLFRTDEVTSKGVAWRAFWRNRDIVWNLQTALDAALKTEGELWRRFPEVPALDKESK